MPIALQKPETSQKRPLVNQAYDEIYRRIIILEYAPGRHLEESQLMADLDIGRTPIREALQRLAADLLVASQPGKGYVVRPLTVQDTKSAFAALQIMELGVASLAVRQEVHAFTEEMHTANQEIASAAEAGETYRLVAANSRFHDLFAQCSRNIYLVEGLRKVRCETNRLAYLSYGNDIEVARTLKVHHDSVVRHHEAIITALHGRELEALQQVIMEHIEIFKQRIIRYLTRF